MTEQQAAEEYRAAMGRLTLMAQVVTTEPLDWLLATIDHAEAVGPVVYPTTYRDADVASQREIVEAAIAFRAALVSVQERLKERGRL